MANGSSSYKRHLNSSFSIAGGAIMTAYHHSYNSYNFSLKRWNYSATRSRNAISSAYMSIFHNLLPCYDASLTYASYIRECRDGSSGERQKQWNSRRLKVSQSLSQNYDRKKRCSFYISSHILPNFDYPNRRHIHFMCGRRGGQNAA